MIKKFLVAALAMIALQLHGQNSTISPYSYFGLGELRAGGTIENQLMGRLSMYTDSVHLNFNNPAAYGKLKLTTYTAGVSLKQVNLESGTESQTASVSALEYLALGFPISPYAGVGLGIMPVSSVGYNLRSESINTNGNNVTNVFTGEGGLNQVHFTLGINPIKNVHLGATVNYSFGNLENERIQSVENVQFGTLDRRTQRVKGYDFNYGLTYSPKITPKHSLFTSVTVNTQGNLGATNSQRIGSFSQLSGREIETIDVDLEAQGLLRTDIKVPTTTTIGLGFGEDKKWFIGGEYSFQQLSTFSNTFLATENLGYQDASTMRFGGFFVPDYSSFSGYLKRITYRAGIRFEKTGMLVNNQEIDDFGITFGFGLPLGNSFSNANLGLEYGKTGTTSANLVQENYFKVIIGLSLNDRWFQKRKIN
ncbi:MAG: hypothetical protein HKN89_00415 [Eudoraea sp.]|nr:hypothetical protein [Eudoraea sp.]